MTEKLIANCALCKKSLEILACDGDGVWTAFCSPEHAHEWQSTRDEKQIIEETSGIGMPYDRCQWCGCTLKSGYHKDECPVRKLKEEKES